MASQSFSWSRPSSGIIRPVFTKRSQLQSKWLHVKPKSNLRPTASTTRNPSGTTSRPMPSPSITAILYFFNPHLGLMYRLTGSPRVSLVRAGCTYVCSVFIKSDYSNHHIPACLIVRFFVYIYVPPSAALIDLLCSMVELISLSYLLV